MCAYCEFESLNPPRLFTYLPLTPDYNAFQTYNEPEFLYVPAVIFEMDKFTVALPLLNNRNVSHM